jgi:hypothetical protein
MLENILLIKQQHERGCTEHDIKQNASFFTVETSCTAKWYLMYRKGTHWPVLGPVIQRQYNIADKCIIF